jgi:hypothetical protein
MTEGIVSEDRAFICTGLSKQGYLIPSDAIAFGATMSESTESDWTVADLRPEEIKPIEELTPKTKIIRYVRLSTLFLYLSDRVFIPSLECLRVNDKFEGEASLEIPRDGRIWSFLKSLEQLFQKKHRSPPDLPASCPYHPPNYLWRKKLAERRAVWCWNLFENEEGSNAMWQLYGHKGVAIQSTIGDLKKAMANSGILRRLIARVWYGTPKASYLSAADAIFEQ